MLDASRLELAQLLLQPAPLVDLSKLATPELRQAQDFFKAALDAEGWQTRYEDLADEFASKLKDYAERLNDGELTPAEWRRAMENTIRAYYARAYQMGASVQAGERAFLSEVDHATIGEAISDEFDYLRAFFQDVKQAEVSAAQIEARTQLYGNAIHGLYWQGRQSVLDQARDSNGEPQYLVEYDAKDDSDTCSACQAAADGGPYDPKDAPVPGAATCLGLDNCRCEWKLVENPDYEGSMDDSQKAATLLKYCAQPTQGPDGKFTGCEMGSAALATRKPGGGRSGAGATNFVGASGKVYTGTQAGDVGEHIAETVTRPIIADHFGGEYVRISGVNGGPRTTPWDGRVGKDAFDIKTISASASSQKAAIKAEEIGRKIEDARAHGWTSNIILQRIDPSSGRVDLYLLRGDTKAGYIPSKSWKSKDAVHLGGKHIDFHHYFKVAA